MLRLLGDIAPEADLSALNPDMRIRDQLDIDSMDALSFLIAMDAELDIYIPEADYPKLTRLSNIVNYFRVPPNGRLISGPPPGGR